MKNVIAGVFLLLLAGSECSQYLGCYIERSIEDRLFKGDLKVFWNALTHKLCRDHCREQAFKYAGVQYRNECFCSNDAPPPEFKTQESECNMACAGNPDEMCGGSFRIGIFELHYNPTTMAPEELFPESTTMVIPPHPPQIMFTDQYGPETTTEAFTNPPSPDVSEDDSQDDTAEPVTYPAYPDAPRDDNQEDTAGPVTYPAQPDAPGDDNQDDTVEPITYPAQPDIPGDDDAEPVTYPAQPDVPGDDEAEPVTNPAYPDAPGDDNQEDTAGPVTYPVQPDVPGDDYAEPVTHPAQPEVPGDDEAEPVTYPAQPDVPEDDNQDDTAGPVTYPVQPDAPGDDAVESVTYPAHPDVTGDDNLEDTAGPVTYKVQPGGSGNGRAEPVIYPAPAAVTGDDSYPSEQYLGPPIYGGIPTALPAIYPVDQGGQVPTSSNIQIALAIGSTGCGCAGQSVIWAQNIIVPCPMPPNGPITPSPCPNPGMDRKYKDKKHKHSSSGSYSSSSSSSSSSEENKKDKKKHKTADPSSIAVKVYKYLGCFKDKESLLSSYSANLPNTNTPVTCIDLCVKENYKYAGVTNGHECYCGNRKPDKQLRTEQLECSTPCAGNGSQTCGGKKWTEVYKTK